MDRRSYRGLTLAVFLTSIIAVVGCSTQSSSAPFHIYDSPLVDAEMPTPRHAGANAPGVEARQLFVYRHFKPGVGGDGPPPAMPTPDDPSAPRFDRVTPPDQPVLASYNPDNIATDAAPAAASFAQTVEYRASVIAEGSDDQAPNATSDDAAAYIYATLKINDIDIDADAADEVPNLYRQCRSQGEIFHSGQPDIGDLVFFHNTYDRNDDGRNNDWYTLAGIVSRHLDDGTVEFVTYDGEDVSAFTLNLDQPAQIHSQERDILNSRLRAPNDDDPPYTRYLAGELFAGYCNILGERPELILIDNWSPSMNLAELSHRGNQDSP